jgi:5'-deoxynucleotidase YfbR-like HD superfamily hydrolase
MHDASEAYMCDVPTPLKKLLPEYQKIESRLMQVIKSKFLINGGQETEDVVAYYDILMLKNEALHERGKLHWLSNAKYKDIPEIDNFMIYHLRPEDAKLIFLQRFNQLYNEVSDKV